jgi:hypothetical protein
VAPENRQMLDLSCLAKNFANADFSSTPLRREALATTNGAKKAFNANKWRNGGQVNLLLFPLRGNK